MLLVRSSLCGGWHENSCLWVERAARRPNRNDSEGYYSLLGVSPDADDDEIKSAGRRMLKETHPDLGGSQEEFERVVEAYRILSDRGSREKYNNVTCSVKTRVKNDSVAFRMDDRWAGEPIWYKEPAAILPEQSIENIRAWHGMLLDAARDFRLSLEIKAGVCRCPTGYGEMNGIALIDVDTVPERWAAFVYMLKRMCDDNAEH